MELLFCIQILYIIPKMMQIYLQDYGVCYILNNLLKDLKYALMTFL